MDGYDVLARFYDAIHGDRPEALAQIRSLLERHRPGARTVLELACGTGSVLAQLDGYDVTGVDLSPQMLELARQKLPGARFVQADMTEVRLGETFDVVLCVYDSINHLLRFEDWERAFDTAREHLGPEGVFVFDVNTPERLQAFADGRSVAEDFGEGNVLVIAVESSGQDIFTWQLRVFERLGDGEFRLHQEAIREAVFPVDRIRAGLGGRFGAVHELESGGRLYFACTAA